MNGMQKVLVVDNGERAPDSALSAELAGMGYASVTAPFEAADDVLALIPSPAAVLLHMPQQEPQQTRDDYCQVQMLTTLLLITLSKLLLIKAGQSSWIEQICTRQRDNIT